MTIPLGFSIFPYSPDLCRGRWLPKTPPPNTAQSLDTYQSEKDRGALCSQDTGDLKGQKEKSTSEQAQDVRWRWYTTITQQRQLVLIEQILKTGGAVAVPIQQIRKLRLTENKGFLKATELSSGREEFTPKPGTLPHMLPCLQAPNRFWAPNSHTGPPSKASTSAHLTSPS